MKQLLIWLLLFNCVWAKPYFWTQYSDKGIIVRSITSEFRCPDIKIANTDHQMTERYMFEDHKDVMRVCEYQLSSFDHATLYDQALPKSPPLLEKIVVIGNNGHTTSAKYFEKVTEAISREAPDLIIHLGNYTQSSYDPKNELGWQYWEEQFFIPLQKIQTLAPFIFVRGQQEACQAAWFGWQSILANNHYIADCQNQFPSELISFNDVQFVIHDSSNPQNSFMSLVPKESNLNSPSSHYTWLLTANSPYTFNPNDVDTQPSGRAIDLMRASREIDLILTSQISNFQAIKVSMSQPLFSQITLGTSGSDLEKTNLDYPQSKRFSSLIANLNYSITQHGYLVLNREGGYWSGLFKDPVGQPLVACKLSENDINCRSLYG